MDLDLQQFGTTIAIGLYVIFVVDFALYPCFSATPYPLTKRVIRSSKQLPVLLFVGIAAFSFGILLEHISDEVTDETWFSFFVDSEANIRTSTLFNEDTSLTSLGRDLHQNNVLNAFGYLSNENLSSVANETYYFAKNIVFTYDTYFEELSKYQVRINFIRSFSVLSALLFVVTLVFKVVPLVLPINLRVWLRDIFYMDDSTIDQRKIGPSTLFYLSFSPLLAWLCISSYVHEETQYNRRVYGYLDSLVAIGRVDLPEQQQEGIRISGITGLRGDQSRFIAVVDEKDLSASRVFWLFKNQGSYSWAPIPIDWREHRIPTDLEGVCSDSSSVWVMESSHWNGQSARILEIQSGNRNDEHEALGLMWKASKRAVELPPYIVNVEGLECRVVDGQWWFLLGERSIAEESGIIYRYKLVENNDGSSKLEKVDEFEVSSPFEQPLEGVRQISDLTVVGRHLIASSAKDLGDDGPFESFVYSIGCVDSNLKIENLEAQEEPQLLHENDIKIEGISAGLLPEIFMLGSDNENEVGNWIQARVLGDLRSQCGNED